ncbi:DUF2167 domain-containing protein [Lysobacter sp. A6]|uniref:DUF2167 domain-containing protein n=1 Tax=Noviluteimonas lactosilytica TaxID=2888523 RepID=A0ABS8JHM5_9GAMM|nr:DUF2167 domain-containing protein [Lysobacter lactosilyticus]MCC8363082.1 DUF2167 domain-containing protein [Lysobacter lactosilyticus]
MKWSSIVLPGLLAVAGGAFAQDASQEEAAKRQAEQLVASLHWKEGEIAVPSADAKFRLGSQFHYLEASDAQKVLEDLWGNPPDDTVLGMVVPKSHGLMDDASWAVVVTYSDDGYVSDEDAKSIDYAELLSDMQEEIKDENEARKDAGYEGLTLHRWAEQPHYDASNKKLYWAKDLEFEGSEGHTLNYDIRVLGRGGYLSLNAVANMESLPEVRADMQQLLPMVEFDPGARYADYNAKTDKVAAYGIAALVGGGVAAKAGLFGKLGVLLLGLKKLLIPIGLVLAAFGKKIVGFFTGDKDRSKTVR